MTKEEAVKAYKEIAEKLQDLHSSASEHISRRDNNRVFDIYCFLDQVADRIENEYDDLEY